MKDGVNGWLVPPGQPSRTADILFDFYTGKIKLDRPQARPDLARRRRDSLHFANEHRRPTGLSSLSIEPTSKRGVITQEPEEMDDDKHGSEADVDPNSAGVDPNTTADRFVNDIGAPFPAVHPDSASPSEDVFTIGRIRLVTQVQQLADIVTLPTTGNAARWLLIISLMSGKAISPEHHSTRNGGNGDGDIRLLESMGLSRRGTAGGREAFYEYNNQAVWKMLMGEDIEPGEGSIIWNETVKSQDGEIMVNGIVDNHEDMKKAQKERPA